MSLRKDQAVRGAFREADGSVKWYDAHVYEISREAGSCTLAWADGSHSVVPISDVRPQAGSPTVSISPDFTPKPGTA